MMLKVFPSAKITKIMRYQPSWGKGSAEDVGPGSNFRLRGAAFLGADRSVWARIWISVGGVPSCLRHWNGWDGLFLALKDQAEFTPSLPRLVNLPTPLQPS